MSRLLRWPNCSPPEPVAYAARYPDIDFFRPRHDWPDLVTKAAAWRHEREWRMMSRQSGHVAIDPDALDGVILGHRIGREVELEVHKFVDERSPRPQLLRAAPAHREFRLVIQGD